MIQVNANANQENTGGHGHLPGKCFDIHCEHQSGDGINYLASSCYIRLNSRVEPCKNKKCARYIAKHGVEVVVAVVKKKTSAKTPVIYKRKTAICLCCEKEKEINARGLCIYCYQRNRRLGTLDDFTRARKPKL